jgi:hypothetical protein
MFVDFDSARICELDFQANGLVKIGDSNDILTEEAKENIFSGADLPKKSRYIPIDEIADVREPNDDEETDEVELDAEEEPKHVPDEYERLALEHGGNDWDFDYNGYELCEYERKARRTDDGSYDFGEAGYWTPALIDLSGAEMDAALDVAHDDYGDPYFDAADDEDDIDDGEDSAANRFLSEEDADEEFLQTADLLYERDVLDGDFPEYDPLEAEFQLMLHLDEAAEGYRPKIRDVVADNPAAKKDRYYTAEFRSRGRSRERGACINWKLASKRRTQCRSVNGRRDERRHVTPVMLQELRSESIERQFAHLMAK